MSSVSNVSEIKTSSRKFREENQHLLTQDLSEKAPNWFKEDYLELLSFGMSKDEAVKMLKRSQFFNPDWVLNQ